MVCNLLVQLLLGLFQSSHSWAEVPQNSRPYFTVSFETPLTWRARSPYFCIPQEQGGPVIPPGTGFPFCRLLRLAGLRWRYSNPPVHGSFSVVSLEVEVKLRPTVSQPVRLGVGYPSGARDQFFFLSEILFRQLRVCYFVASSLTRGSVCNLLLLLVFASSVPLGSESLGTQDHILLSQFLRLPQTAGPGPRIYIPQEQGVPVIPQGTGFLFRRLLQLAGLRWRYSLPRD
jgi:hypothetical protein